MYQDTYYSEGSCQIYNAVLQAVTKGTAPPLNCTAAYGNRSATTATTTTGAIYPYVSTGASMHAQGLAVRQAPVLNQELYHRAPGTGYQGTAGPLLGHNLIPINCYHPLEKICSREKYVPSLLWLL